MATDLISLIKEMKVLDERIEKGEAFLKGLRKEYDKLRLVDIPNAMAEADDLRSIKGDFGRCTLTADLHVSVLNKPGLHVWLEENGSGSLIVPTVNAQTLKAFCKEQMKNGELLPEDILKLSPFTRAVLYKS